MTYHNNDLLVHTVNAIPTGNVTATTTTPDKGSLIHFILF